MSQMTSGDSYREIAAELKAKAAREGSQQLASELGDLARCYLRLAAHVLRPKPNRILPAGAKEKHQAEREISHAALWMSLDVPGDVIDGPGVPAIRDRLDRLHVSAGIALDKEIGLLNRPAEHCGKRLFAAPGVFFFRSRSILMCCAFTRAYGQSRIISLEPGVSDSSKHASITPRRVLCDFGSRL